ncbi:UNVERIFIED_CONTAM: hypothetical protein RF648_18290, partial [Kocuria sp. CPCC 205274]
FLEKMGGGSLLKWGLKSAYKVGTNATYDATVGTLGMGAHTAITGGDFNAGEAAVSSVIIGAGFRGAGKVLGYGGKFVRNPEATINEVSRTVRNKPETVETGDVSQNVVEQPEVATPAPEEGHVHDSIAHRLVNSESARTNMQPDPTLHEFKGDEQFHHNGDGSHYTYAEPKERITHSEDVILPDGKRLDAGNPLNPHTQTVDSLMEEAITSGKAYRAAYSFGDALNAAIRKISGGKIGMPNIARATGTEELGYAITREGIHPTIRGYGMMLANPATGLRDLGKKISEGWVGQRLGKHTATEIVEMERRSDMGTLADLKRAEKRMMDIPEYEYTSSDGSPLSPKSDAEKLEMMRRDIDTASRNGDISGLPPEMQEYAAIWRDHFNVDKAGKLLDPESAYAAPGAQPIISDKLSDGTYLPAHYDRPAIWDVLETEFNGDREAMQNAMTDGDMESYLTDPTVRKRVDDM